MIRGVSASDRGSEIALYTGNDDNIVGDLSSSFVVQGSTNTLVERHFVGGLLGHWAVWTRTAVECLRLAKEARAGDETAHRQLAEMAGPVTDANAAVFDVANKFRGVIAGVHEVLHRQGLLAGIWCLDPLEGLSPGQAVEISRVIAAYPNLQDEDNFIARHIDDWLR